MNDEIKVFVNDYGNGRNLVMLYVDPVSGKRVTKSAGTTDRDKAQRRAGEWEKEVQNETYRPSSKITWTQFRERYEAEYMLTLSHSSQRNFTTAFNHLERLLNPDRLSRLTTAAVSKFQTELRKTKMKETTIAGNLRHLKAALRWAERQGLISKAPRFIMPKAPRGNLAKGRPIVAEEYERMLTACEKERPQDAAIWKRLLTGLWLSGLRLGEALDLSWDYEAPFRVDLSGKRPVFVIQAEAQKSRRGEILPMTPDFAEWLQTTFPEGVRQGKVFGIDLGISRFSIVISEIGKKAGIITNKAEGKYASAHDFRRAFGTRWAKKVMPPVLQRLMRHADLQTTMSYYVNLNAEDIADGLWDAHEKAKKEVYNTSYNIPSENPVFSEENE
jgi:integrase